MNGYAYGPAASSGLGAAEFAALMSMSQIGWMQCKVEDL